MATFVEQKIANRDAEIERLRAEIERLTTAGLDAVYGELLQEEEAESLDRQNARLQAVVASKGAELAQLRAWCDAAYAVINLHSATIGEKAFKLLATAPEI